MLQASRLGFTHRIICLMHLWVLDDAITWGRAGCGSSGSWEGQKWCLDWLLPVTATRVPGAPPQGWPWWSTWLWHSIAHAALSSRLSLGSHRCCPPASRAHGSWASRAWCRGSTPFCNWWWMRNTLITRKQAESHPFKENCTLQCHLREHARRETCRRDAQQLQPTCCPRAPGCGRHSGTAPQSFTLVDSCRCH